jgi:cell division protein FtsZ
MGTGTAAGENRAVEAKKAISSRLLEENTIQGARGAFLSILLVAPTCCFTK